MRVIIGLSVALAQLHEAANKLSALPSVQVVLIAAGAYDIVITAVIRDLADLSEFMTRELGRIQGIVYTEVWFITESKKLSYAYAGRPGTGPVEGEPGAASDKGSAVDNPSLDIDDLDLAILREMEIDGRQSISSLAAKLATSRTVIRMRLQRLIDNQITRIVGFTHPALLGYRSQAMIGIKALPDQIATVVDRLVELPETFWVATVAGRYDVIIWVMFHRSTELSHFLSGRLGPITGITSTETMIGLETTKIGFTNLASWTVVSSSMPDARPSSRHHTG